MLLPDITTTSLWDLRRQDFHLLAQQLASLRPVLVAIPQPSDSPSPSSAALIPLAGALPQRERFILDRLPERPLPHNRRGLISGSPLYRSLTVEVRGLPGFWAILLRACPGQTPRRVYRRLTLAQQSVRTIRDLCHLHRRLSACSGHPHRCCAYGGNTTAFRTHDPLGTQHHKTFEADTPRPARLRTYASHAPLPQHAQGSLPTCRAMALVGWVSHPLDD